MLGRTTTLSTSHPFLSRNNQVARHNEWGCSEQGIHWRRIWKAPVSRSGATAAERLPEELLGTSPMASNCAREETVAGGDGLAVVSKP
jgi:hypothetical protein